MSSRKVMQAPTLRRTVPGDRRRQQQTRGIWEWLFGEYWG